MLLTPRLKGTSTRLKLDVASEDMGKVGRGCCWGPAIVLDRTTGKAYRIYPASCGLPECWCDALAVELVEN